MENLNEQTLSGFLGRFYRRHKEKYDNMHKGEAIDDINFTKHHYWQLGFEQGILHALEMIADHFLDDYDIPKELIEKKRSDDRQIIK